MTDTKQLLNRLKEIMTLEERESKLNKELSEVQGRIKALKGTFWGSSSSAATTTARAPKGRAAGGRTPRGQLTATIVDALNAAGEAGVSVRDVAKQIGTKPVNIHAWFHQAVKRYPQIQKVSGGHYRVVGTLEVEAPVAATTSSSGGTRRSSEGRIKRGALSSAVLSGLQEAGEQGISTNDLAAKLGLDPKKVYTFFASTGKKNPNIQKLENGNFKLVGGASPVENFSENTNDNGNYNPAPMEPAPMENQGYWNPNPEQF